MDHLEESPLNLNTIIGSVKCHFLSLFVLMDSKLSNSEICPQLKGLFVSAQWHQKVISAPITLHFYQVPSPCCTLSVHCLSPSSLQFCM